MAEKLYVCVIVGYGPAGITAAIYAARKKLSVLLIGEHPGGEIATSGDIENWPGDGETDGLKLADKFVDHLKLHKEDVTVEQEIIKKVEKKDGSFTVTTAGGKTHQGKTVIYTA